MEEKFTHSCIKCLTEYTDTDPDPYYCSSCNETRKILAKEVDEKMKGISRVQVKSDLQTYEEIRNSRGTNFVNIKDMGIKL